MNKGRSPLVRSVIALFGFDAFYLEKRCVKIKNPIINVSRKKELTTVLIHIQSKISNRGFRRAIPIITEIIVDIVEDFGSIVQHFKNLCSIKNDGVIIFQINRVLRLLHDKL